MKNNKVALVSGGTRGIGRAVALKLAGDGFAVALLYAGNQTAAEETKALLEEMGAVYGIYRCDVADFSETKEIVRQVTEELGDIFVLVNNAGITKDKLIVQMNEAMFEDVINVNLKGAFHLIHHTARGFMKQRGGRIINVSSVVATMGNPGQANYAAAKAGLLGLTKSVAKELGSRGVTCNAITPGMIRTDMTADLPQTAKEAMQNAIPLKRVGEAEEVAALISFLASDAAGYITGAAIPVDGGLSM